MHTGTFYTGDVDRLKDGKLSGEDGVSRARCDWKGKEFVWFDEE